MQLQTMRQIHRMIQTHPQIYAERDIITEESEKGKKETEKGDF